MKHTQSTPKIGRRFLKGTAAIFLLACLLIGGFPVSAAAADSPARALGSLSEEKPNLFVGMFRDYVPDKAYIETLRRIWPDDLERYGDGHITIHLHAWLTLYLDDLEKAGYDFGIIEREDMCTEEFYVVELTEQGRSVIQVTFPIASHDPKYPAAIVLNCNVNNFEDMESLNRNVSAMWIAYETLNIHMNDEKYEHLLENSEYFTSETMGVAFRGQYDGLGYFQSFGSEVCLIISPDFSLGGFRGMQGT